VLKDEVAALYDQTWDLFVAGLNVRMAQWQEEKRRQREQLRAETQQQKNDRMLVQQKIVQRLAKFAGPVVRFSNNYRVGDSGKPMGLLVSTPTFLKAQNLDASTMRESAETRKLLYALEGDLVEFWVAG
jgi:hypothetical protein